MSLADLEKMSYPIIDKNSEFHKLDKIDGLLCLSMIQKGKSWSLIGFLAGYMEKEYKVKGIPVESGKLMEELRVCEHYQTTL